MPGWALSLFRFARESVRASKPIPTIGCDDVIGLRGLQPRRPIFFRHVYGAVSAQFRRSVLLSYSCSGSAFSSESLPLAATLSAQQLVFQLGL